MRNFLYNLRCKFSRFMVGRYGSDQLSRFIMGMALAFVILNLIVRRWTSIFYWLVWILLIITYLRMFSKNIQKRYNENTRYLELRDKVFSYFGRGAGSDASHKVYRCPGCRQKVRVPKGRGKIEISCPKCGRRFVKRT